MDHDAHLRLLGLATARGQQLELVTTQILARTLRVPESTARLLATTMGLGSVLVVLQTLLGRGESASLSQRDLSAWLPKGKAAVEARNRLVHMPWVADAAGVPGSVLVRGTMALERRSEEELLGDIARLATAVELASEMLGHWPGSEPDWE